MNLRIAKKVLSHTDRYNARMHENALNVAMKHIKCNDWDFFESSEPLKKMYREIIEDKFNELSNLF